MILNPDVGGSPVDPARKPECADAAVKQDRQSEPVSHNFPIKWMKRLLQSGVTEMLKRVFGFLIVFALGAIAGMAFLHFSQDDFHAGRPDFVADQPRDSQLVSSAMKERILSRIPIGSRQGLLIDFLKDQGFQARWGGGASSGAATYLWDGPICPETWDVFWSTDPQGIIANIETRYVDVCS